jgi:hypothetical protein
MTKARPRITNTGGVLSGTALSSHDALPFFGGRKIADVESPELTRLLQAAGIERVSANNPRSTNLDKYAAHIAAIHKAASDIAESDWIALGVAAPGTSANNGASTNADLRAAHIETVRTDAGNRAVARWVSSK